MKRIPWPVAILVFAVALFFAYQSFVASFFPRLGQKPGGPPPMPPMALQQMAASRNKKPDVKAKKPSGQTSASSPEAARGKTANSDAKGGD